MDESIIISEGVASSYTYNSAGRLTGLVHSNAGETLASNQYGYDLVENRLQATEMERSTDGGQHWQTVAELPANTLRYVDDGLARHTQYWYRLTATDGQGRTQVSTLQTPDTMAYNPVDNPDQPGALVHAVIDYTYDPLSRLTAANYADGSYLSIVRRKCTRDIHPQCSREIRQRCTTSAGTCKIKRVEC